MLVTGGFLYLAVRSLLKRAAQEAAQRGQAEAEMASARVHYHQLLETSSDGIHVLNEAGELIEANAAFYQMLGCDPENPPALQVADWDAQWSAAELKTRMQALINQPQMFETLHRRRDGQVIPVEVNARRIEFNGQRCL